ncbi:hypothetical protein HPB52_017091 [Rhipicephalus sanguineus]|nr:hypothetical protein HPB52_017091 [Rhipicephalus sanguineus]
MPPAPCAKALSAAYHAKLIDSTRARRKDKVRMSDGVDQHTLRPGADTSTDVNGLPQVTPRDILNYFVYFLSFVTLEKTK